MIDLDCSEIKDIVESIRFDESEKELELTFASPLNNQRVTTSFDPIKLDKSLQSLEVILLKELPTISSEFKRIENFIINNLDNLAAYLFVKKDANKHKKIRHLRKYEKDGKLYESVIIGDLPKFIMMTNERYDLIDEVVDGDHVFRPSDNVTTHNPIPYVFESEEELQKYIEIAKNETLDSLFERVLEIFKIFVNADDHSLVIFAADTVYSYFQDMFGITHYNILVGLPGSGKSSALLVFRILGYRPFYVTSASAANYHTFLGSIQEGQGTIIEDEADNLGHSQDKKNILKTGYSSGGTIPKTDFPNGQRTQESYLSFCHKWLAMEELPDEKINAGIFDRCFIHNFVKGEVSNNIKKVMKDTESDLYKQLIHLRKLLFVFKLVNQNKRFPKIQTNLTDREDELTYPLVSIFYNSNCFEKIRLALSQIILDRTDSKNNSLDSRITETLKQLIEEDEVDKRRNIIYFTNEQFYSRFKEVVHADDNSWDLTESTFYLPDGTKLSKYRLSRILVSKFKAKLIRTNKFRGFSVNKNDIEKIAKQYEVINEIIILEDDKSRIPVSSDKKVTEVTRVTDFKGATPSTSTDSSSSSISGNNKEIDFESTKDEHNRTEIIATNDGANDEKSNNNIQFDNPNSNHNNKNTIDSDYEIEREPVQDSPHKKLELQPPTTPLNCVTSVTSVTPPQRQYPCFFCGTNYKTNIDFDMGNHFVEKHKLRLLGLPISGNLETRIEWAITETKRRLVKGFGKEQSEDEDRGY